MNTEQLREKFSKYSRTEPCGVIADYIVWQLERMSNTELAETTAHEIIDGHFSVENALEAMITAARKRAVKNAACMTDAEGFAIVREYLKINDAVPEEETRGFVPGGQPEPVSAPASGMVDFSIFE